MHDHGEDREGQNNGRCPYFVIPGFDLKGLGHTVIQILKPEWEKFINKNAYQILLVEMSGMIMILPQVPA